MKYCSLLHLQVTDNSPAMKGRKINKKKLLGLHGSIACEAKRKLAGREVTEMIPGVGFGGLVL